jgi:hypothetical protein
LLQINQLQKDIEQLSKGNFNKINLLSTQQLLQSNAVRRPESVDVLQIHPQIETKNDNTSPKSMKSVKLSKNNLVESSEGEEGSEFVQIYPKLGDIKKKPPFIQPNRWK